MVKYQSMLCENPCVQLEVVKTKPSHPATVDSWEHDCLEAVDEAFYSRPDLTDQPITHLDLECFMGGSSFDQDGTHFARYTDSKYAFTTIHVRGALDKEGAH
jgi:hypothetical protein